MNGLPGARCKCGWKVPLHVNIATPKSEPPPSSIQFAVTCPACGAEHIGVVARSKEAFEAAARATQGYVEELELRDPRVGNK